MGIGCSGRAGTACPSEGGDNCLEPDASAATARGEDGGPVPGPPRVDVSPTVGVVPGRNSRLPPVVLAQGGSGQRQPVGQPLDRQLGSFAVERHQRSRASGDADEIGAPPVGIWSIRWCLRQRGDGLVRSLYAHAGRGVHRGEGAACGASEVDRASARALLRRGLWVSASCQRKTLLSHRPSNNVGFNLPCLVESLRVVSAVRSAYASGFAFNSASCSLINALISSVMASNFVHCSL